MAITWQPNTKEKFVGAPMYVACPNCRYIRIATKSREGDVMKPHFDLT